MAQSPKESTSTNARYKHIDIELEKSATVRIFQSTSKKSLAFSQSASPPFTAQRSTSGLQSQQSRTNTRNSRETLPSDLYLDVDADSSSDSHPIYTHNPEPRQPPSTHHSHHQRVHTHSHDHGSNPTNPERTLSNHEEPPPASSPPHVQSAHAPPVQAASKASDNVTSQSPAALIGTPPASASPNVRPKTLSDHDSTPPLLKPLRARAAVKKQSAAASENDTKSMGEELEDDDDDDDEEEEEDKTPSAHNSLRTKPKLSFFGSNNARSSNIYNFQANENTAKREIVQDLIERLKIALTFLLHDESPLWREQDVDEKEEADVQEEEDDNKLSIYAKGAISANNARHHGQSKKQRAMKPTASQRSAYSNGSAAGDYKLTARNGNGSQNRNCAFQQRCAQYARNKRMAKSLRKSEQRLNSLFNEKYAADHAKIYKLWCHWRRYAQQMQDGQFIQMDDVELHDEMQQKQLMLEEDCADFVEIRSLMRFQGNSLMEALNRFTGRASDAYLDRSPTIYSLRKKLGSSGRSPMSQRIPVSPNGAAQAMPPREAFSEEQLKKVKTRDEMKRWIARFKSPQIINARQSCCHACCGCKWMKQCFGERCCECTDGYAGHEKEEKNLRIPMDLWSWQNVVAAIEDAVHTDYDGREHSLKHFASVFWQYRIQGKELVVMDVLQIELLVECWFLNNIKEEHFDEVKLKSQKRDEDGWHLSQESQFLIQHFDRLRIQTHVISRYHLCLDIVQLLIEEQPDDDQQGSSLSQHGMHELLDDAIKIKDTIDLLRSGLLDGPKKYWKIEAHFFDKIDNYLSVLVCSPIIRDLYFKCFPDFLYEEQKDARSRSNSDLFLSDDAPSFESAGMKRASTSYANIYSQDRKTSTSIGSSLFNYASNTPKRCSSQLNLVSNAHGQDINSFHAIQSRLNQSLRKSASRNPQTAWLDRGRFEKDVFDKCVDVCCPDECCGVINDCIHNLDRLYLKVLTLIVTAMVLGCFFVIGYYYQHGKEQANDAMFLSLEAIGDRASYIMTNEFWTPQMGVSTMIGGLTTGDLLPNASLYEYPNYRFDRFFAQFGDIRHSTAIFGLFMYNPEDNTVIGAYRIPPGMDSNVFPPSHIGNETMVILHYNGTCRTDRIYDRSTGMRIQQHPDRPLVGYLDCTYNPKNRRWYKKTKILGGHGASRSAWTEPYVFNMYFRGMSYVAPIIWKGKNLTFVADVTVGTLASALNNEVNSLPGGSLWMLVTPRHNAIASSNNETLLIDVDADDCVACTTSDMMVIEGVDWMKENQVSGAQHVTALAISASSELQISVYSFTMNHLNLYSWTARDHNEEMIKPLTLENSDNYQYGYFVIVNNDDYMLYVNVAWWICWIITWISLFFVVGLVLCNIRYNNIEQTELGRAGRSGIIRQSSTKRIAMAQSNVRLFHHNTRSGSYSSKDMPMLDDLRTTSKSPSIASPYELRVSCGGRSRPHPEDIPVIGDRVKTRDNLYGIIRFVGEIDSAAAANTGSPHFYENTGVLLELEQTKERVLVTLANIVANFGPSNAEQKAEEEEEEEEEDDDDESEPQIDSGFTSPQHIDKKILASSFNELKALRSPEPGSSIDHEQHTEYKQEEGTEKRSPSLLTQTAAANTASARTHRSNGASPNFRLSERKSRKSLAVIQQDTIGVVKEEEEEQEEECVSCCGVACVSKSKFSEIDDQIERCCYIPQKTLLYVTFMLLCATLLSVVLIWEALTTDATMTLFNEVMAEHEWLAVQDRVVQLFLVAEVIADSIASRFHRGDMDLSNSRSLDRYFGNLMQSFVDSTASYYPFYVYIGTPTGQVRGARIWSAEDSTLLAAIRDQSTNDSYDFYFVNTVDGYAMRSVQEQSNEFYDPRCRVWYKNALYYSFEGTIEQAFPNGSYLDFKHDAGPTAQVSNCLEYKQLYEDMWQIGNISLYDEYTDNVWKYPGQPHDMVWSRYLFAEVSAIGITGSQTIIDPNTGQLLAVVSIDYTLDRLSMSINDTTKNPYDTYHTNVDYQHWHSWIFEAQGDTAMIASSDGVVLRDAKSLEGCYGFLVTQQTEQVPYNAYEHPNRIINVYSKEIIDVYGVDYLDINASSSQNIRMPEGTPMLEAGRIQYYPGSNASIDWVVLKTMDVRASFVDDLHITAIGILLIIACVWVLIQEFDYSEKLDEELLADSKRQKRKRKRRNKKNRSKNQKTTGDHGEEDEVFFDDRDHYFNIMNKMKPIIEGAANVEWNRERDANQAAMNSIGCASIVTTSQAKNFLAKRANQHIASENENNAVFRECAWHACDYKAWTKRMQMKYWEFVDSNYYDVPVQLCLLAHLMITFFEPSTPADLKENGLDPTIRTLLAISQFIQWMDCLVLGLWRYFEYSMKEPYLTSLFELNYGLNHKYTKLIRESKTRFSNDRLRALYLAFRGPQSKRYWFYLLMVVVDFINFVLMVTIRVAPFSYYLPMLPFLIIVRNQHVLMFGHDFVAAIVFAREILFSYFCFILIFAILAMSLFRDTVNYNDFADSFQTIHQAFITGFVFISTTENYAIMYDIFESDYYSESHWIVIGNVIVVTLFFAIMGMFCWIPMIIDKFEQAFEESNMRHDLKNKTRKTNAIIAAFIMLDFNGDLDIDVNEFQYLVSCSVLVDKNKLFDAFDENQNQSLDIVEFVNSLLKQSFRTKIQSTAAHVPQFKFNAWMECNVFRHRNYGIYVFVFLVVPVVGLALITGLSHRFDEVHIYDLIFALFIANMAEIHLRCLCYGVARFWDLLKYPNPNYIVAAINSYKASGRQSTSNAAFKSGDVEDSITTIRLSSSERNWVTNHLPPVRPLSILEKSTETLINRLELVVFWFCLAAYIVFQILFMFDRTRGDLSGLSYGEDVSVKTINNRYQYYFILLACMIRIFTLIPANKRLVYVVFYVIPPFIALFAFLGLYIYAWARIGCTLFGDYKTDIVIPDIYDAADGMVANFNSLEYAILALIQLMIGEGWHEIMYYNVIGTQELYAVYFITYITVVSIIIANVFVGLFLADIDELAQEQSHDEIIQASIKRKSFQSYAVKKLSKLSYKIKINEHENESMRRQSEHIQFIQQQHELQREQLRNKSSSSLYSIYRDS